VIAVSQIKLGELMSEKNGSVDPSKHPEEVFDLYSIPAFDRGEPEVVVGAAIGSTKQVVTPQDTLLSKIVPHIRRTWVVGGSRGRRLIASGEWIVFRDSRADPEYLRHVLRGDHFHTQFMKTVAGVGGSLLRARPAQVAHIEIPLPPIPEQRRIAAILDQADALRAQRRQALAVLDRLAHAVFVEMFGNPASNPMRWPTAILSTLAADGDGINYGVVQPGDPVEVGVPLIRVGDLVDGTLTASFLKRIDPTIEAAYTRSRLRGDEILVSCVGSIGVTVLATPAMKGFNIARAVARIPLGASANRIFIASHLMTNHVQRYFTSELRTVAQPTLNIKQLANTVVLCPPLALQEIFAARVQAIESLKSTRRAALAESDALFASLQHRAFSGAL
jgi:type I restriction enzyme S subunit